MLPPDRRVAVVDAGVDLDGVAIAGDLRSGVPNPVAATEFLTFGPREKSEARAMIAGAAYKVSYAFGKANGVVVTAVGPDRAEVAVRTDAPVSAIAELRRVLGVPVQARRIGIDEFDELVSTLYNGAEEGAAALAGDLAQDLA